MHQTRMELRTPEILEVKFFKDGIDDFINLLKSEKVPFEESFRFPSQVVAASGDSLEIMKAVAGLSITPSIAAIVVQWLKNRSSRKVILQMTDKKIVHIEGYSKEEISNLIADASSITIIQTEPDQ
ncbi:hypothetical protein ACJJIE_17765 [Microbulbifer sp. TRSA001]|uniref:hypothetical protein n=1 Tax=Microbulbifer sp. TRSA001 TaxID=3243381 RepID=UPI0040391B3A